MTKILLYAIGALLLALGVSLVELRVKSHELGAVRAGEKVLKAEIEDYKSANVMNEKSITTLQLMNRQCVEKNAANEALAQTYFNAERDYAAQLQVAKAKVEHSIQVIYEHDPSARQWARPVVPTALAERLRANAGADRPHADR